ncbi:MAG TPA: MerC domain-containing protein [Puia sp.]|nr:MerC domain-containing protein [Puia sp.]
MPLRKINLDALGMGVSVACAIHCALLPVAMATLPFFGGMDRVHNTIFEYGMIGLAFVVGITALRHGYRRHHRSAVPAVLFIGGMILLIAKQIWQEWEGVLLAFAVLLILAAHGMNYRLIRRRTAGFSRIHNQQ